jgi:hypothetical protein
MIQPASLNTKYPDRSFSEAFAMFQHHSMMDRASDEVDGDQPAPGCPRKIKIINYN